MTSTDIGTPSLQWSSMFSTVPVSFKPAADAAESTSFSGEFSFYSPAPRPRAQFASISMSRSLQEPHTGVAFPADVCHGRTFKCPTLTGLGVRAKRVLGLKNVNVYALGVYLEAEAAKQALHGYRGKPVEVLEAQGSLYDDVITSDKFDKSLRLVVNTDLLTKAKFMAALNERLGPELKKEGKEEVLADFQTLFDEIKIRKGTEITFYQTKSGSLVTTVDGKQLGILQSPALCRSMLRIYLGADPVSQEAKEDFGHNLARMLQE